MRKTLDQIMREHPLLQTYLALGGTYHFDSRDIVLNTPGRKEEILWLIDLQNNQVAFAENIVLHHIEYMEEQLYRQHEYEQQVREIERFELQWGEKF